MKQKGLYIFLILCVIFSSCKTKQIPPAEIPVVKEIAFIQVADRGQISFKGLPCTVTLSDGNVQNYTTDDEGKIIIKADSNLKIVKIVYNFNGYTRTGGKLLAKEDFKLAKKVKTNKNTKTQEFQLNFTLNAGAKTILILDIF